MIKLTFSTTACWSNVKGFGCASLGLPGLCSNEEMKVAEYPLELEGIVLTGSYEDMLASAEKVTEPVQAAIVVFGNAGGENTFLADLQKIVSVPMVGGGAAIDVASGKAGLIPGDGPGAVFLITDRRYSYTAVTQCIHDEILGEVTLTTADPRTIITINGQDAAEFLAEKKAELGISEGDFEHLTISDLNNINAHLSCVDGVIKSGRDVNEKMILRRVDHAKVYDTMRAFYDDPDAIVFGCAGLSGLLDKPLDTTSLGLFLFGEVCTVNGRAEFGNLMLSKLVIK